MPTDTQSEPQTTALATVRQRAVVESVQPLFDTAKFEHFQRAATALMNSTLLSPSVKGDSPQQCFSNLILIFEVADRWRMPATALAQCVSVVHGKLMFEGKVITAMLESTLAVRLHYHWTGERGTPAYRIYVSDKPFEDLTPDQLAALAPDKYPKGFRMIDGSVGDWQTFQKDGRSPNPAWTGAASRNQLAYRGSREWARLYEPGQMLGVYGDDEITAWEERATPAAQPAITTGFSKPAEPATGDGVVDAEFEAVTETQQQQEPAQPAKRRAAKPSQADADQARDAKVREETQARLAKCEEARQLGHAAGFAGQMPNVPLGLTEEEQRYWLNGHREGLDARPVGRAAPVESEVADPEPGQEAVDSGERSGMALEAFEAGHEAGLRGDPGDVPRAWSNWPDDFSEGWNAGAAERLQDQADDGTDTDEDEAAFAGDADPADEDGEPSAFDRFAGSVRGFPTWGDVKRALTELTKTEDWKAAAAEAGAPSIRQARICAGLRLAELQAGGKEALDVQATDLTAFRCWMETVDDSDLVQGKWQELVQSPAWSALTADQRGKMEKAVKARMEELK